MWVSNVLVMLAKIILGVNGRWKNPLDNNNKQKIYFANHSSHIDTIAILTALPNQARKQTSPIAAADYWGKNKFTRFISLKGLNAVLIDRKNASGNVLAPVEKALQEKRSIIIFPEGTRREQALPGEFKSGLYHLAQKYPDVELIPIYLNNVYRCMPKGTFFPLPLICTVRIGSPLEKVSNETKYEFLKRARQSIIGLAHEQ